MLRWLIGIILGEIICESSNWQHIQRLKITILGPNWQLLRLERIAKCSYFILSTQNIKFYWFVIKIKKSLLPIWWYNRGLFPLGNKYFGVFVLNGVKPSRKIHVRHFFLEMEWDVAISLQLRDARGIYRIYVAVTGSTWLLLGVRGMSRRVATCHIHPVTAT